MMGVSYSVGSVAAIAAGDAWFTCQRWKRGRCRWGFPAV